MTIYNPRKHGPLPAGTRVRLWSQQYPSAYTDGTATIVEMTRADNDGTHEYTVRRDDGTEASWNYIDPVWSWTPANPGEPQDKSIGEVDSWLRDQHAALERSIGGVVDVEAGLAEVLAIEQRQDTSGE